MKDIVKNILKNINEIYTNFNYNEINEIIEKCKVLDCELDNEYFTNLLADLEDKIKLKNYSENDIYIQQDFDKIKSFLLVFKN